MRTSSGSAARYLRSVTWGMFLFGLATFATVLVAGTKLTNPLDTNDPSGTLSTFSTAGGIDLANPFFQNLGTNGRSCGTCHVASDAMTVTPPDLQARFNSSNGTDPI